MARKARRRGVGAAAVSVGLPHNATAATPHQQAGWRILRGFAPRTPGQGRQFKNSSISQPSAASSPQGEPLGTANQERGCRGALYMRPGRHWRYHRCAGGYIIRPYRVRWVCGRMWASAPTRLPGAGLQGGLYCPPASLPLVPKGRWRTIVRRRGSDPSGHCQLTTPQSGLRPASSPSQGSLGTVRHGATSWHVGAKNDLPFPGGRSYLFY